MNASELYKKGRNEHLKYLFLNVKEIHVANFLRFLGYWETFGYDKPTGFGSSVRVEILVRIESDLTE